MATLHDAIAVSFLRNSATENLRIIGLADGNSSIRAFFSEDAGNSLQCPTGSESGNPVVQAITVEICENFRRGCFGVCIGVCLILKLTTQKPIMFFRQFNRFLEHAAAFQSGRS